MNIMSAFSFAVVILRVFVLCVQLFHVMVIKHTALSHNQNKRCMQQVSKCLQIDGDAVLYFLFKIH